ncbi:tautomerase family protein [Pendulispora albinea]|uniref:Tautomerase family protein n=1 Tax=Pendulispora albinea TaxID=2741071 RepID=A0ABZ2M4G9_9BACT
MPQVKVYGLLESIGKNAAALSEAIHAAMVSALKAQPDKKFQRFFAMDRSEFLFPSDRSDSYTIIEVSMFEGRSVETKKSFIRQLLANIERDVGIRPYDLEVTLFETPRANWAIRGVLGDELQTS